MSPDNQETRQTKPVTDTPSETPEDRDSEKSISDDAGQPVGATTESMDPTDGNEMEMPRDSLRAAEAEVLRSQAELENYRKRARREMEEERRYACLPLMRDLLPVLDNLQRALAHATQAGNESEALVAGVQMVAQELTASLQKHHCRLIEADGIPFDPNYHEAIGQQPSAEVSAGHVAMVVVDGYQLHDRVIRPSQVLVSTGAPTS